MSAVVVSGSAGLIGSETCKRFHQEGFEILGIDNDMRGEFFGREASTMPARRMLEQQLKNYRHFPLDIRERQTIDQLFQKFGKDIKIVIHTAAQPSHDWAAR